MNDDFVSVFHNSETGSTYFAYIERGERVFGINGRKGSWHLHPFGDAERHVPFREVSIQEFLEELEKELRKRGKLPPHTNSI